MNGLRRRIAWGALLLCASGVGAATPESTPPLPYVLDGTEVRRVRAERLQRDYELFVGLPASYDGQPSRRYPVLFVTDANYAFPLLRSIARRVGDGGRGLEEFILVGLSYAKGDTPEHSRRRDYTPTARADAPALLSRDGVAPIFGQAEAYRQFIAEAVFPFVASHYRADMTRKIFAGHSYGGLFGTHVLLTEPTMFQHYILGSPSLWYDGRVMFARERAYAASHRDLKAEVFLAAGSFEAVNPTSRNPRYQREGDDMVRDVRAFERVLKSRGYPGLRIQSRIVDDEDHLTVAPAILTRGLMWALPGRPHAE